jgi:hypothetical protein
MIGKQHGKLKITYTLMKSARDLTKGSWLFIMGKNGLVNKGNAN